jgi:hypothetical protein
LNHDTPPLFFTLKSFFLFVEMTQIVQQACNILFVPGAALPLPPPPHPRESRPRERSETGDQTAVFVNGLLPDVPFLK